ncbi:hypothetical protein [uncultured Neglectibacter sp.]|uniref:hypothetical protein n=1 Tax=uncultured Neglectibacter sp. TaxID=1924108 RepID=UPI0034DE667B
MINEIYSMPEVKFVAGETQTFVFHLYFEATRDAFNANGCKVNFAVIDYTNKSGKPLLCKKCKIRLNSDGVPNIAEAYLTPEDTAGLYGKYVYQLQIRDIDDEVEIPGQGLLVISKNIHKGFIYHTGTETVSQ